ncbi:ubiquitin carboxyl-terminal hydrolase 27 isoform X2 [Elaeis guineensis]|uniref:ubiquitinyl hydrolase 1 n=1 Tax=Elaeis guineensis var. tenera TaxID=51953 RepID=A0A6J0PN28_ELAGV|nr:ubiquitin carboxyl-terminal hydrolase 27 isoform X2 [Elaeis guineensis]
MWSCKMNLGNNCFLNVILQALASCSCFLPFLQNILAVDGPWIEELSERMPLTVALTSLLKELCIVQEERTVLNPRKVMVALSLYVSSFSLRRQQDAAEALIHLLSSLEEEISQSYVPHGSSIAGITAFPSRICVPSRGQTECKRWRKHFFGPFDGTIGSMLTCRSCSSMLSMDFEHFCCLPLSPVLDGRADIIEGCTLVDCLKHFTAVEHLENYHCGSCWHIAALKYLSLKAEKNEAKINMLSKCIKFDSCDCRNLFLQEEISWTGFSHALKQLSIACCPKILCIHLQRASMNRHGELIKLQGHISFPLLLDLFPFMEATRTVEQQTSMENMRKQRKGLEQPLVPQLSHLDMHQEMRMLPHIFGIVGENISSETLSRNKVGKSVYESFRSPSGIATPDNSNYIVLESMIAASDVNCSQPFSSCEPGPNKEVTDIGEVCSTKSSLYCLSSVVEHYGRTGSGHYAIYRRVASEAESGNSMRSIGTGDRQWLYISDHEASSVTEEAVFAAEASLLFYEKIESCL